MTGYKQNKAYSAAFQGINIFSDKLPYTAEQRPTLELEKPVR